MQMIIGLLMFWLSVLGYKFFLEGKYKIKEEFTIPIVFASIGIAMFILGILNMLKLGTILIAIFGIALLVCTVYKEKNKKEFILKKVKKSSFIVPGIIFIYITIISLNIHVTHYDNFSHWALILKNMFVSNSLPNFENPTIMFKGYQPGSACFIYYFAQLCGKTEFNMIIGQNYLILSFLIPLYAFIKEKKAILKNVMFVCFYLFIMLISIQFNNLLVDSLIATNTIAVLAILYYYQKEIKKGIRRVIPLMVFLLLVKNTGLVLDGICCIYILYIGYKTKSFKEVFIEVMKIALILIITLLVWQNHVSYVYGTEALSSKHSLSTSNIVESLREKGVHNIFVFTKNYALHLFNLSKNPQNIVLIIINIIMLCYLFIAKKRDKNECKKTIVVIDLIYLFYFLVLGLMYILSMPWEEAKNFASYDRYMTTINIVIVGICMIYIFMMKEHKKANILSIITCVCMLSTAFVYVDNRNALIGNDSYKNSPVEKFDSLLKKIPIEKDNNYYIYNPSSKGDFGYFYYLSKYKINTNNITIETSIRQMKEDTKNVENALFIIYEENQELKDYLKENNWKKENKIIYRKNVGE